MSKPPIGAGLNARLATLAVYCDAFETPTFAFYEPDDGLRAAPVYSAPVKAFVDATYEQRLVQPFDWLRWLTTPEGRQLAADPAAIAQATPMQLVLLISMLMGQERYVPGTLENAHRRGIVVAILRRARELGPD